MDDLPGNLFPLPELIEKECVVSFRRKIHYVGIVGENLKTFACVYRDDVRLLPAQFGDQIFAFGRRVTKNEPWPGVRFGRSNRQRV